MQIKPQKAHGVLRQEFWHSPEWVAEEKFDGDRRIAQFCGEQGVRFTGTRESVDGSGFVEKSANLPHLWGRWSGRMTATEVRNQGSMMAAKHLVGTVLDGEIVCPETKGMSGGRSKYVTAVMGSKPERAVALQRQNGWMEYRVFDCLWYKGKDLRAKPLRERRVYAARAVTKWSCTYATMVPQFRGDNQKFFRGVLARGGEGVVLKHQDHTYGDESLWVKVKGEWTADVVVMGFKPGKGKYVGMVGAIEMGQWVEKPHHGTTHGLRGVGTCRGFTDAFMLGLTKHPKKYLNQVIEITHNGREPTGAFRHPRFKRFRPDKSPKDCVYREDEI